MHGMKATAATAQGRKSYFLLLSLQSQQYRVKSVYLTAKYIVMRRIRKLIVTMVLTNHYVKRWSRSKKLLEAKRDI